MNDIRTYLNLLESKGIANRKPGDTFVNDNGDEIYFQQIKFYPEVGQYNQEELTRAVATASEQLSAAEIIWTNAAPKSGGFALAEFQNSTGQTLIYGRYFQSIKSPSYDNKWDNNSLPGYRYAGKSSQKVQIGYMPQDVLTDLEDQTSEQIVSQIIEKFGPTHSFSIIANAILTGEKFPITAPKTSDDIVFTAFRDYFCEILQPIALQKGLYSGNAADAEKLFLGEQGFDTCKISFGSAKTQGLSDSIMVNPMGVEIKISSKGATGAAAGIKNLLDVVDQLKSAGKTQLIKEHQEVIDIIEIVKTYGQNISPVALAIKFGIISSEEGKTIGVVRDLSKKGQITYQSLFDNDLLSDNLKKIYRERTTADAAAANAYYHLLAGIAFKVSDYINKNTNFSQAASDLLNSGSLIQVYTQAKETSDSISITAFETVYPSKAITGVAFWPGKTYYSTGVKGNFTFKILRNGAKDITEPTATTISTAASVDSFDPDQIKSDITARNPRGSDTQPDDSVLGRTRRK